MAASTRTEPIQQIQKAPTTASVYLLASNPANGGKYEHKSVTDLGLGGGTGTAIPPSVITDYVHLPANETSKIFTVALPLNKTVGRVLIFQNQSWAFFASYTTMHYSSTVDITVTGYSAIEGDSISLLIFWE